MEVGDEVICINDGILSKSGIRPPLFVGRGYIILDIVKDSKGNNHLDVGLLSRFNYVTSLETGESLPNSDKIHWCHPSRFELNKPDIWIKE